MTLICSCLCIIVSVTSSPSEAKQTCLCFYHFSKHGFKSIDIVTRIIWSMETITSNKHHIEMEDDA